MLSVAEGNITKDTNNRERLGEFCDFGTKGTRHQFKHSKGHKGQILYYNEKGIVKVMPIYANLKTEDIKEKIANMGYKLYNRGEMYYSGCLIEVPSEFKAGQKTHPAGIYKLRSIKSNGPIKIENNNGEEIITSAIYLTNSHFRKLKS